MKTLEEQFEAVLKEMSKSLTVADVDQIRELANAGELGVAFENFCTQLYERDAVCSRVQINRITAIGNAMGIKPDYWKNLGVT